MFIGEYSHTIDSKGRVAIPFRFRKRLGKGAVVTRNTDHCLVIYPKEQWEKLASKLTNLPVFDSKARALTRFIFSGATDVEFDKQGRALIPEYLRNWASLSRQVIVTGLYEKIEIWDQNLWVKEQEKQGVGSEQFNNKISELGI